MDFSSHEQSEGSVRLQVVKLLLQLNQPARSQVNVLQKHPRTSFGSSIDGLFSKFESFIRPHSEGLVWFSGLNGKVVDFGTCVISGHRAEDQWFAGVAFLFDNVHQIEFWKNQKVITKHAGNKSGGTSNESVRSASLQEQQLVEVIVHSTSSLLSFRPAFKNHILSIRLVQELLPKRSIGFEVACYVLKACKSADFSQQALLSRAEFVAKLRVGFDQ
mmetsp:Transcript_23516/g.32893  ORF Transcript_23516/g.32893 Transcript_23516/m.32893 type:complete len:217 (+) Transcript_23516:129-779(+)